MTNKEVIIAFYIKDGASKLIDFAQNFLNRKKNKKHSTSQEIIEYDTSVINFISLKTKKPLLNYYQKEVLSSLEGKTRSSKIFQDGNSPYYKDISSFKLLYKKYLSPPEYKINHQKQSQILIKNIKLSFGYKLFNNQFESTQILEGLRQVSDNISGIKQKIKTHPNQQLFKKIEMNGLSNRTVRLNQEYHIEQRLEARKRYEEMFNSKFFTIQNLQESQQYCGEIINSTICRWFSQILEAINMKDLLSSPAILVQWENSLIQKEKHQIIAQQINGKMLFQIQQKISTLKGKIQPFNSIKQAQLRQKKSGLHSLSFQQNLKNENNEKSKIFGQVQQIRNKSVESKSQQANKSYEKMANRIQNLRKQQFFQHTISPNIPVTKDVPQEVMKRINHIGKQSLLHNYKEVQLVEKPNHQFSYKDKDGKRSPLRPQDMSKFKMLSRSKMKKIPLNPPLKSQTNMNSQNPRQKNNGRIQIKFPIKIENFEMQSWAFSFLCYRSQTLNLKQLPLTFMKDRHKFGENRVKIEYPYSPEEHDKETVYKGLQVLNCLGAEVYCEQEISYKNTNKIDSAEILAISWLLQRPVKQVVEYYGQFYAGCSTKK